MNRYISWFVMFSTIVLVFSAPLNAETRRDAGGGAQASKKAQYMIRQLHNEKQALQAKLAELQGKFDKLEKQHEKTTKSLDKSSNSNDKLVSRVKDTVNKYNDLAQKYRQAVSILKKSNLDNQYMVRAVQEREEWIAHCTNRNDDLFDANSELLTKYGEVAGKGGNPFTGLRTVEVENEMQDYQFKLEDLQVTKFKPSVNTKKHIRKPDQVSEVEQKDDTKIN